MKKRIVSFLVCAFFAVFAATSVYAHTGDVLGGTYLYNSQKDLQLRITQSAQTSLMNSTVYNSALAWNNISSNVHVSVIMETPGMPTIAGTMNVYGSNDLADGVLGRTVPYNSSGSEVSANSNWSYVVILINTTTSFYNTLNSSSATNAAKMNFIHEVGHALKLSHPEKNTSYSGHNKGGLPYAVMNQGYPSASYPAVSSTVEDHDKSCLKAKWGA